MSKYVLCAYCKNKIHIDHFAGVFKKDNKEMFVCDRLPCLLRMKQDTEPTSTEKEKKV